MRRTTVLTLALLLLFTACGTKDAPQKAAPEAAQISMPTWQEQYDLGMRYLTEGNYQEAIIAFTAAIEIDPKQAETYLSLADVYIQCGDYDKAIEILRTGLERTNDNASIAQKIAEITDSLAVECIGDERLSIMLATGVSWTALGIDGVAPLEEPFVSATVDSIARAAEAQGFNVSIHELTNADGTPWRQAYGERRDMEGFQLGAGWHDGGIVEQDGAKVLANLSVRFNSSDNLAGFGYPVGIHGIAIGDQLETVLRKLEFSNAKKIADGCKATSLKAEVRKAGNIFRLTTSSNENGRFITIRIREQSMSASFYSILFIFHYDDELLYHVTIQNMSFCT